MISIPVLPFCSANPYFFTKQIAVLCSSLLLMPLAVWGDSRSERMDRVIENLESKAIPGAAGSGKLPYGIALAHLHQSGGSDAGAREYVANAGYGGELFFNSILQVRGLYTARDHWTAEEEETIREMATDGGNDWGNEGTENHRKMVWSSGYLLAQYFPEASWEFSGQTVSSTQLMRQLKDRLIEVGRNQYRAGYSEFLSPNYELFHVAPMVNLYDFAEDAEVRAVAAAFLHYHFANLALGSFEEVILPPWSRYGGSSAAFVQDTSVSTNGQLLLWLYWGHGDPGIGHDFDPAKPLILHAMSDWQPPEILDRISLREVEYPFSVYMQQTHWQWNPERYVMRTTYHDELFAMSSGVIRHVPAAFQKNDSQFGIAWEGGASVRQVQAFHPYWYTAVRNENDWNGRTSPFMQTGQHEDAAIMLFDIPPEDPWAGVGIWAGERAEELMPLAQMRFPAHMDYEEGADNWIFLADGPVYIGIRVLKDGWRRDRRAVPGWNVIKSEGTEGERWQSGFIFEVGTEAEFGSFAEFQAAVESNPVEVDWVEGTARYETTGGDVLELNYNESLEPVSGTVPDFTINGVSVAYDETWPNLLSPYSSLADQDLRLDNGDGTFTRVDWGEPVPVLEAAYEGQPGWAGYPLDAEGRADTGDFLGEVYPNGDWVFVYRLNRYIYLPESHVENDGAWIHWPNSAQ